MSSEGRKRNIHKIIWIATGFAFAVVAGLSFDAFVPEAVADDTGASQSSVVAPSIDAQDSMAVLWAYQEAFRYVVQEALPVVVKIDVVDVQEVQTPTFNFWFFQRQPDEGEPETQERKVPGLGSGVIVRLAGDKAYVLTNDHVVGDADEITVTLYDGSQYEAAIVGTDPRRDLALVVFETDEDIPVARLGDSGDVEVGDWAFAVGNPLGFESTVTAGIVSALGRRQSPSTSLTQLTDYIQTDAAINQGNSGGALVNLAGEVIGINTWIASQSGGNIGLGFAIPINNAKRAIDEFISYGTVEYGWLGIQTGGALTEESADSMGIGDTSGALVGSVFVNSPAEDGGLLPGDIIRQINGMNIDDWDDLLNIIADLSPGSRASFRIWRDGRTMTKRVEIGRRDEEAESAKSWPGIAVQALTEDLKRRLGLRNESGDLVISYVQAGSDAADAGLRQGDIIREVNDVRVGSLGDFYREVREQADDDLVFRIARQGREVVIGIVR